MLADKGSMDPHTIRLDDLVGYGWMTIPCYKKMMI
jgi:hypothetical protein